MSVDGGRAAELIIGLPSTERTAGQVLQLASAALIADLEIQLSVGPKQDFAAVVISSLGLAQSRATARVSGIRLVGTQRDDVPVECQHLRCRVPDKTVYAVSQQRDVGNIGADNTGHALRP